MNKQIEDILLSSTKSSCILNIELIQNLWSGYGSLNRVTLDRDTVIVKLIKFPTTKNHPRGWNSNLSHLRKVKSYQVEMNWYQHYNERIDCAYSPRYLTSGKINDNQYLVLEDLNTMGLTPKTSINSKQVEQCLKWLAHFHAKYLGVLPNQLWDIGTYWHLDTRPDELEQMDDIELKEAAYLIDKKLNSSKFKTIVHGDAKLANFLFSDTSVAAVDFQYVGGGVGIKDIAYFLSSIYDENELHQLEETCLSFYFKELKKALSLFNNDNNFSAIENEWRELYPYAWADFYRFLQGWSPGHSKMNSYSEQMKKKVLKWI